VVYPEHLTDELDYELELAVVIRKAGKWFGPEEAMEHVGGYLIFNDITARDIQRREMESGVFSFCKAIDTFCPLGPWIVTPDEIPDPHDLAMELRVNGEKRQASHSSRMSVTIPEILSNFSALGYSAGDVLSTGTVAGVAGFKSEEERRRLYLKPGDVIEAEIERIGVLRNPAVAREPGLPLAVRGGGHGVNGHAVCDDGIMLDLSPLKRIDVDPEARVVRAQAGVNWGEFDAATQAHGLATTGGRVTTTGIAGLTLGTGSGWLERLHGYTADNLISADVVTAGGRRGHASQDENAAPLWGLRGGRGDFGVGVNFEYGMHELLLMVAGGMILWVS